MALKKPTRLYNSNYIASEYRWLWCYASQYDGYEYKSGDHPSFTDLYPDHKTLLAQIIAADDGSEPHERSRHNLIDPTNDEVMAYVTEYMDATDFRLSDQAQLIIEMCNRISALETKLGIER